MLGTYISAFIVTFGGGFSWFFVKNHSMYKEMPIEFSIFYRQFFAAIFVGLIGLCLKRSFKINLKQFKLCLAIAVLYYIIYFIGAYNASIYLVSGIVAFISSMKVLFTEIILAFLHKHRPSGRIIVASILASIGITIMSKANMDISHLKLTTLLIGLGYALLAPVGNSVSNIIVDVYKTKIKLDNFTTVVVCSIISSLFFLVVGLIKYQKFVLFPMETNYVVGLTYLSCVSSGITMVCVYHLIKKLGSVATTYMSLFHAPFAMVLAILFQGYNAGLKTYIGLGLCTLSLYISNKYNIKKARYDQISKERKRKYKNKAR